MKLSTFESFVLGFGSALTLVFASAGLYGLVIAMVIVMASLLLSVLGRVRFTRQIADERMIEPSDLTH